MPLLLVDGVRTPGECSYSHKRTPFPRVRAPELPTRCSLTRTH